MSAQGASAAQGSSGTRVSRKVSCAAFGSCSVTVEPSLAVATRTGFREFKVQSVTPGFARAGVIFTLLDPMVTELETELIRSVLKYRRDVAELTIRIREMANTVDELRRDSGIQLRRCGELQHEINELKRTRNRG